jgi:hypothetical protein
LYSIEKEQETGWTVERQEKNGEIYYLIGDLLWLDYKLLNTEFKFKEKEVNIYKEFYDNYNKVIERYKIGIYISCSFAIFTFCLFSCILVGVLIYNYYK